MTGLDPVSVIRLSDSQYASSRLPRARVISHDKIIALELLSECALAFFDLPEACVMMLAILSNLPFPLTSFLLGIAFQKDFGPSVSILHL